MRLMDMMFDQVMQPDDGRDASRKPPNSPDPASASVRLRRGIKPVYSNVIQVLNVVLGEEVRFWKPETGPAVYLHASLHK